MSKRFATIVALSLTSVAYSGLASAQSCDEVELALELDSGRVIYGAGSASIAPLLASLATLLLERPKEERVTLFYADAWPQCEAYALWREPTDVLTTFKYWDDSGVQATCTAPFNRTEFAHLTHAPSLCPGEVSVPGGAAQFPVLVQPLQSYAHPHPCHGYFEYALRGELGDHQPCETSVDCDGAQQDEQGHEVGEQCRYGFCEAY